MKHPPAINLLTPSALPFWEEMVRRLTAAGLTITYAESFDREDWWEEFYKPRQHLPSYTEEIECYHRYGTSYLGIGWVIGFKPKPSTEGP